MKKTRALVLAASISMAFQSHAQSLDIEAMDTGELFQRTIDTVPECIEYCVDGMSLYMVILPFYVYFYWTPNVSHNSPDLLLMAHNSFTTTPYKEFNGYIGKAYTKTATAVSKAIFNDVDVEIGGGRTIYKKYGQHQSLNYKETTGVGHPASFILKMFSSGGLKPDGYWVGTGRDRYWHQCRTHGCIEEENSAFGNSVRQEIKIEKDNTPAPSQRQKDEDSRRFLSGWPQSNGTTTTMLQSYGGNLANHDSAAKNDQLSSMSSGIGSKIGRYGSIGNRIFCPINVTPFVPYYLSGLDAIQWRGGYPLTDLQHSAKMMNPLSGDIIGRGQEKWGHLYPRQGTVNNSWDSKSGAVVIKRAASILNENKSTRVVNKPDDSNNGFGGWSKFFPVTGETTPGATSSACHKRVANTGITNNENGSYAWSFWRRYNCDLRTTGIHIMTIKFGPICLTDKVPQ